MDKFENRNLLLKNNLKNGIVLFANRYVSGFTGGDKHFIEISKRWVSLNLNVTIILSKIGKQLCIKEGLNCNYRVISFSFIDRFGLLVSYLLRTSLTLFLTPKLSRKSSIAYSTSQFIPDTLPGFFMKKIGRDIRWVVCIFHLIPHYSRRKGSLVRNFIAYQEQKLSFFLIKQRADIIFVDNSILKKELTDSGFDKSKIFIISMGIDKALIDSISTGAKKYDGVFLGRLHPTKGIFDLVKIWKLVVEKKPTAKLAIIGEDDNNMKKKLELEIINAKLTPSIEFLGFLDTLEAFNVLKQGRVFVFPSHEEGWGIAIAEAMACGLPVIAWALPVYNEVFPKGMIRIAESDVKGFAAAVVGILGDKAKCEQLGNQARELAIVYDWEAAAKRELEIIQS